MNQESLFIQRAVYDGEEIDLSFLKTCTLIETLDLSGPKLIMTFHDPDSILRDDMGVGPFCELDITFADYWNDNSDFELKDTFNVLTMPVKNSAVTMNCFQKDMQLLKVPATRARMFVKQPVSAIVQSLVGMPCIAEGFPVSGDYHLLPGERPSVVLRQMARELGGKLYYQRRQFIMKKIADMMAIEPDVTYAYGDLGAENKIIHYRRPNSAYIVDDSLLRSYCGWNMVKGMVRSTRHTDRPKEMVSNDIVSTLDNLTALGYPEVDFTVQGSGMLRPGIPLKLEWHLLRNDVPIDESLPDKVVIGTAAHFYSAQKYFTRIKGILPI